MPAAPAKKPSPFRRPLRIVNHKAYLESRRDQGAISRFFPPAVLRCWLEPVPDEDRGRGPCLLFSDLAIATLLAVKASQQRSLSYLIGSVRDYFRVCGIRLPVPAEGTISTRAAALGRTVWRPVPGLPGALLWMRAPTTEERRPIGV